MSYSDDLRESIFEKGSKETPEYAQKKVEFYKKSGSMNYAMYKSAKTKSEAQSRYANSQSAYNKAKIWQEVLQFLLSGLKND